MPASLSLVISAGQLRTGTWSSFTVTVNVQPEVLPAASCAIAVTVVIPTPKKLPDAGLYVTVAPGQLSLTPALKFTTAPHIPGSLVTNILAGQVTTGSSVSLTVTVNEQLVVLLAASIAVAVTWVVPIGNTLPEAGL